MELRAPDTGTMTRQVYGEIESVVMENDAVLVLGVRGRAGYAQAHVPKRRGHHRVPRVLQCCLLRH